MKLKEFAKECERLIDEGYGDARVIKIEEYANPNSNLVICSPKVYHSETSFGKPFNTNSKEFVFIDKEY